VNLVTYSFCISSGIGVFRISELLEILLWLTLLLTYISDHNSGSNKKKLAGILVGCIAFIAIMTVLGYSIHRIRRKKLEKPGKLLVVWNWFILFMYKWLFNNCNYAFIIILLSFLQGIIKYLAWIIIPTTKRMTILTYRYLIYQRLLMQLITSALITNWDKEDLDQFTRYNRASLFFFLVTISFVQSIQQLCRWLIFARESG
jgi:hypothetical protein